MHPQYPPEDGNSVVRAKTIGLTGYVLRDGQSALKRDEDEMLLRRKHVGEGGNGDALNAALQDHFHVDDNTAPVFEQVPTSPTVLGAKTPKAQLRVRISFLSFADPRGSVPKNIVNLLASKVGPTWHSSLQKACDRFDP